MLTHDENINIICIGSKKRLEDLGSENQRQHIRHTEGHPGLMARDCTVVLPAQHKKSQHTSSITVKCKSRIMVRK